VVLKDYNFKKSTLNLLVEDEIKDLKALEGTQYFFAEHYAEPPEGKAIGTLRKQEILARRRVFFGAGNVRRFHPGATYTQIGLADSDSELSVEYIITEMTSEGSQPVQHADRAGNYHYANEFTCIPKAIDFRPERKTPWPQCGWVVHATVCAAPGGGQYAHVDDRGRYKVKFLFDINHDGDEDKASCWVRLIEPYVGSNFGFHSPLLKGVEVLVAFENGDPDRPIIVGCVYNNEFPSPTNNNNNAQSHWRSAANNEIRYTDTQGSEEVFYHAQKDVKAKTENDEEGYIGNDEKLEVKNNRERKVGVDEKIEIGSNKEVKVGSNSKEEVGGDKKVDVKGKHEETIGGTMDLTVKGAVTMGFNGAETITIGGKKEEKVDGKVVEEYGAAYETTVGADRKLTVSGKLTEKVSGDITVNGSGKITEVASGAYELKASSVKVTAKSTAKVQAGGAMTLQAGGAAKLKSAGAVTVESAGAMSIKASGAVKIKGSGVDAMDGSLKVS
jgi:type VI secretion system secreted protein VgrG